MNLSKFNTIVTEENLKLIETTTLLVYELENNEKNDLFILSKLLDEQSLTNLINYYNGTDVRIPSKKDYYESSILALYFFLIDVKNYSFQEATKIIKKSGSKIEIPEIVLGKRLSKIRRQLAFKLSRIVEEGLK